jgi:hypothetical protein
LQLPKPGIAGIIRAVFTGHQGNNEEILILAPEQTVNAPLHLGVANKDDRLINVMKSDPLVSFFF